MEARIVSKEQIKPSSPTPKHLKTHMISLLDQLVPDFYFPLILFYSAQESNKHALRNSDHLKKSLSETLTHFYTFAGRLKDEFSIDCDDYGATFVEAQVACKMSEILKHPDVDVMEVLVPCKLYEKSTPQVSLAIQVNYFQCGGVAICACFRHVVGDATTAANFIKSWAALACGSNDFKNVMFDGNSIFPSHKSAGFVRSAAEKIFFSSSNIISKRFVFDGTKIASLREKIQLNEQGSDCSTRFEAISTLILGAMLAAIRTRDNEELIPTLSIAVIPVNLRKRMNPTLPAESSGNIIQMTFAELPMENTFGCSSLMANLQESTRMINDNFLQELHATSGGEYLNYLKILLGDFLGNKKSSLFNITSWCKLPFYEADFGWGKPIWVSTALRLNNFVVLLDTCDGEGIEAWVALPKEDMEKFERDPSILAYAAVDSCIS